MANLLDLITAPLGRRISRYLSRGRHVHGTGSALPSNVSERP
jgi:hypothetical protein